MSARRKVALGAAAAVIFAAGVGLGQALDDNPRGGGTQTVLRTLDPLPLAPAARTTVTVTTSAP
jgi:hypothetical protein